MYESEVQMLMKEQKILKANAAESRCIFRDQKPLPKSSLSQLHMQNQAGRHT